MALLKLGNKTRTIPSSSVSHFMQIISYWPRLP